MVESTSWPRPIASDIRWEQRASSQLRAGRADVLDAYFDHRRISACSFDDLTADIARRYLDLSANGRSVAVVAETNEHVDALNAAIQRARRSAGHLGRRELRVAGAETVAVGDHIVTRRNDRTLRTDRGEPVRNRDRWTVPTVHRDGSLTASRANGHGTVSLPAAYVRDDVRLGYAATAHGQQGDTVDVSLTIVTEATTHRSLYVGATRGRNENRLFVVTDEPEHARDVLERVLINDRADLPAVAQRRNLANPVPRTRHAEEAVAAARRALAEARREAEPFIQPLREAEAEVQRAAATVRDLRGLTTERPRLRRRGILAQLGDARKPTPRPKRSGTLPPE